MSPTPLHLQDKPPLQNESHKSHFYREIDANEDQTHDKEYDFFISYKSDEIHIVREIVDKLIANGLNIWFDEYRYYDNFEIWAHEFKKLIKSRKEEIFQNFIADGIRNSRYGLVFTNDRYIESKYCREELEQLLQPQNCGPDNIIEIRILREEKPHKIHQELTKVKGMDYSLDYHNPIDVLEFLKRVTPFSITKIDPLSVTRKKSYYSDNKVGYRIEYSGWSIHQRGDSRKDQLDNIDGPVLGRTFSSGELLASLIIGPVDTLTTKATPFSSNKPYFKVIKRALKSINQGKKEISKDDEWEKRFRGIDFAAEYEEKTRQLGIHIRPIGVHLFYFGGCSHLALTYHRKSFWTRRYAIILEDPKTGRGIEFAFVFKFKGDFKDFCRYTYVMEALVNTLDRCDYRSRIKKVLTISILLLTIFSCILIEQHFDFIKIQNQNLIKNESKVQSVEQKRVES